MIVCTGDSMISNNPPAAVLELTKEEAELLLAHCDSNIAIGLQLLSQPASTSTSTQRKVVDLIEVMKGIREKLIAQKVRRND